MTELVSNGVFVPGMVNMLIIDPQVDFHEGGNLAVPGANEDSNRTIAFISKNEESIKKIVVTLDTHTKRHIGHPGYWKRLDGKTDPLPTYTTFKVVDKAIVVNVDNSNIQVEPVNQKLTDWTIHYIKSMTNPDGTKKTPKGVPLIWPIHCIERSNGHKVYTELQNKFSSETIKSKVEYHIKGQNEITEMYSIFKAEVPVDDSYIGTFETTDMYNGVITEPHRITLESKNETIDEIPDHANLNTRFNSGLFESLVNNYYPIVICGQALSHCVNWSLRDLVEKIIENNTYGYYDTATSRLQSDKVILLINASSAVSSFEGNVVELIQFCKQNNVSIKFLSEDGNILDRRPISYNPHADILKTLDEYFPDTKKLAGGKSGRRTRKRVQKRRSMNRRNRRKYRRTRK